MKVCNTRHDMAWINNFQVYLPALEGHLPVDVIHTFHAFLDFCYIIRQNVLTEQDLTWLQEALDRFHKFHVIFETTGVRPHEISLPRQHSLVHYASLVRLFGAPNGLCLSLTESKHIRAVKEPWRRSNRNQPLGQMLVTNQRLGQLTAARTDFVDRGMLSTETCNESYLYFITSIVLTYYTLACLEQHQDAPIAHAKISDHDPSPHTFFKSESTPADEDLLEGVVTDLNFWQKFASQKSRVCSHYCSDCHILIHLEQDIVGLLKKLLKNLNSSCLPFRLWSGASCTTTYTLIPGYLHTNSRPLHTRTWMEESDY